LKYLDEYRDGDAMRKLAATIAREITREATIMEVCGGQTHSIVRHAIDEILPPHVRLVHGPGCPVCVTPLEMIDRAHAIAGEPGVTLCSFGDMLRVPGSRGDLLSRKAAGADVRIVYSPLDALALAKAHPNKRVVLFAVGFETTAPATAMTLALAKKQRVQNFSALVSHVRTPPAMVSILQAPQNQVQAFLGPGHVCTVMGVSEYEAIAKHYRVPVVITGFEPLDLLEGIYLAARQLQRGEAEVALQYRRAVRPEGNVDAKRLLTEVFDVCDRKWRGLGNLPKSGLRLSYEYRDYDAERIFDVANVDVEEPTACISGQVLRGERKPTECPAFGTTCTPENPLGATMVSSEGACAAYYAYGRAIDPARLVRRTLDARPEDSDRVAPLGGA
jgi:hydrogenase expression/formation protein HypD